MPFGTQNKDTFYSLDGVRLNMRAARKEINLSLRELAKKTNYTYSYLCNIEQGNVMPSISVCKKIADSLMIKDYREVAEQFYFKQDNKGYYFESDDNNIIRLDASLMTKISDSDT